MVLHLLHKGSLHVIAGCMSSGKSEELVRLLRLAPYAKMGVIAFNHVKDPASADGCIRSRDGSEFPATVVRESFEVLQAVKPEHDLVGVNEAQFFDPNMVMVASALVDMGKRVVMAGLDTDYRGDPFPGPIANLLAIADVVTKSTAFCVQCHQTATRTQLLVKPKSSDPNDPSFVNDAHGKYEARCRACHNPNP